MSLLEFVGILIYGRFVDIAFGNNFLRFFLLIMVC